MKKVAVLLCGSGFKDGSEIREAVGVLWALSAERAETQIFALDEPQSDVVNCLTGEVAKTESRNQLVESARIARGSVAPLADLNPADFDAFLLPGGFGAAKNLCSFAREGSKGRVHPEVKKTLEAFFSQGKPIGAVCIAPAVLALAFPQKGLELTLGAPGEAAGEIEKLGHRHIPKKASECLVDAKHKIVSSPAYMYESAPLHEVFTGIQALVREVCRLA